MHDRSPLSQLSIAACAVLLLRSANAAATPLPADVIVYGNRPATFRDGVTPFPQNGGIFEHRRQADDPMTRLKFRQVDGLVNQLGLFPDRIGSFGKYVFVGNSQTTSLGGDPVTKMIGVFDSETRRFCPLVLDPQHPGSNNNLVTADPGARRTRVIVGSGVMNGNLPETALAYVEADLDSPDPCAWRVVRATAAQLNIGFGPDDQICPGNFCVFDSMALLAHEAVSGSVYGRDYVAVGDYFSSRLAVVRIDASGVQVVDTYRIPHFALPGSGGACYVSGAARRPSSDVRWPDTRPANDWRFLFSYDSFLVDVYRSTPPPVCATPRPFCPLDLATDGLPGASCSGSCSQGYCAGLNVLACNDDSGCDFFGAQVGPCQRTCLQKSPLHTCKAGNGSGSQRQCLPNHPDHCPAGETCSAPARAIVGPSQEYRLDRATSSITPTSPMFFAPEPNGTPAPITPTSLTYDSERSLWVQGSGGGNPALYRAKSASDSCTVNGVTGLHVPAGEHCYYNPSNPATATLVTPDQTFAFERTPEIPYIATTAEVNGRMYVADTGSLQFAQRYAGAWFPAPATDFKAAFAFASSHTPLTDPLARTTLPAEPRRCSVSLLGCNTDADCGGAGETCLRVAENAPRLLSGFKFVEAGGAPLSLWVTSGYAQGVPVAQTDMFLVRVPAAVPIRDGLTAVRAASAWDGDRLWLIAEHDGQLKYRIRDDGQWSAWFGLGTANVTTVGGAGLIAGASGVRVYARDSGGRIYQKALTSARSCAPGSCVFGSWSALLLGTTGDDIAATSAGTRRVLAVRGSNDGVYINVDSGGGFGAWTRLGSTLLTNAAPAIAFHPADGRVWIAVRNRAGGPLMYSRVDPGTRSFDSWLAVPATGAPAAWGTGPALVSDGVAVRLYALDAAYPQWAWQSANDGSGWTAWRKPLGGSWGTKQPTAANVNGEVNLITDWFTAGMQEASLP